MEQREGRRLVPYLSRPGALAVSVGTVLGWGLVVITGNTYLAQAGPVGSVAGLLIGALIMLVIGSNYAYMMNTIPDAGGAYAFAKETYGYDHGFLNAWFLLLTYIAMFWANVTAIPLFLNYFFEDLFHFGFHYSIFGYEVYLGEVLLTAAVILAVTLFCTRAKKAVTSLMILLCTVFSVCIFACFFAAAWKRELQPISIEPLFLPGKSPLSQVIRIAVISPWAYIGYENISHSSEEFLFPVKKTAGIFRGAILLSAALYVAVLFLSVSAYPPGYENWLQYISDCGNLKGVEALPAFYAARHYLGGAGVALMVCAVIALVMTSLIGNLLSLSRLLFAMAKDAVIPERFARLGRKNVPERAMWLVAGISLLIPFLGRSALGWIVDVTTIGATILFGFVSASAWKMARSRGEKRYQFTGLTGLLIMILFAFYLLLVNLASAHAMEAESYFLFTVWTVLGFVFFFWVLKKDERGHFGKSTIVWVALLLLVLFTALIWMSQTTMDSTGEILREMGQYYENGESTPVDAERFLELRMAALRRANMGSMLVVILLFAVSLGIHLLLQRQHQALEREKMRVEEESRAKSRFLFNMSHDIRTPMNAVLGFAHLAQQGNLSAEEKDVYLQKIEASGQQLLAIINDVLDMSRIESGRLELLPEPMRLDEVLKEGGELFADQMREKKIAFQVDVAEISNVWVLCDKNRLNRVLFNLLGNALKFTPEGGRVSLTAAEIRQEEARSTYEIRVKDNGIGMSEEFLENVFAAFERERTSTVSRLQGTGLGLSIAKGIVDRMEGEIRVASKPGEGSEFVVTLRLPHAEPVSESEDFTDAAGGQTQTEAAREKARLRGRRFLVVEDNAINMEIACMILSQQGVETERADDGKVAVSMVEDAPADYYDAVLMDIQMPVMNGYEATRAIRALPDPVRAGVPIIAMTANVFQEDIQAARNAGMDGHIAKPLDLQVMMCTISEVLSGRKNAGNDSETGSPV